MKNLKSNHFEKLKELYYFEQQLLMNDDPGDDDWIDDHQTIGDEADNNEIYYGKDFKKSSIKEERLFFVH